MPERLSVSARKRKRRTCSLKARYSGPSLRIAGLEMVRPKGRGGYTEAEAGAEAGAGARVETGAEAGAVAEAMAGATAGAEAEAEAEEEAILVANRDSLREREEGISAERKDTSYRS